MSNKRILHPDNPFSTNPPNFIELFKKYPYLEVSPRNSKLKSDSEKFLRSPYCDTGLSKALMKEYFDLELCLQDGHMLLNIASVMDHMLWIQEVLNATYGSEKSIRMLDIGSNASFFYPLLGAKVFQWNVVCMKADLKNFDSAVKNVEANDLTSTIQVLKVSEGCLLSGALTELENQNFDLVICTVPEFHCVGARKTNMNRLEIKSKQDLVSDFVQNVCRESFENKKKIKMCFLNTKGSDFRFVKNALRAFKRTRANVYHEYGLVSFAWAFSESVVFPRRQFRIDQRKHPVSWDVPQDIRCLAVYDRTLLSEKLMYLFKGLLIPCEEEEVEDDSGNKSLVITAYTNTWKQDEMSQAAEENGAMSLTDQETCPVVDNRGGLIAGEQERRNELRERKGDERETKEENNSSFNGDDNLGESNVDQVTHAVTTVQNSAAEEASGCSQLTSDDSRNRFSCRKRKASDNEPSATFSDQPEDSGPEAKRTAVECPIIPEQTCPNPSAYREETPMDCSDGLEPRHLVKARLLIQLKNDKLCVEMHWISGTSYQGMIQIFRFMREYLKYT